MSSKDSKRKGDALERRVRAIIEAILESDPKFKGAKFSVDANVHDRSTGVHHELDLLVKTFPNSEYEATFIFECKNWKEPVGKDHVMILAKKVDELRANRGFLVAKSVSRDAKRQLERESRVGFIRCSEDFLSPFNTAQLIYVVEDILPPSVVIQWRWGPSSAYPTRLDLNAISCRWNGIPTDFLRFVDFQINNVAAEVRNDHCRRFREDGTHWVESGHEILFAPNEFVLQGIDVESIGIPFRAFVTVGRRKIISKFELEGRGQSFSFEPIDTGDPEGPLNIEIIARPRSGA